MPLETVLTPLTAVEAVNNMLLSIGQGAINSIESSESVDAENAKTILRNASRQVQARGWYFNREYGYTLTADSNGRIDLPATCLKFTADPAFRHCVERDRALYDTENHTYTFEAGYEVTGTIVFLLPFDQLPQAARDYIGAQAGRHFQIGRIASDLLYRFTREMEQDALTELTRAHLQSERPNPFTDNYRTFQIARQRRV